MQAGGKFYSSFVESAKETENCPLCDRCFPSKDEFEAFLKEVGCPDLFILQLTLPDSWRVAHLLYPANFPAQRRPFRLQRRSSRK
jgi:hypothetical protein